MWQERKRMGLCVCVCKREREIVEEGEEREIKKQSVVRYRNKHHCHVLVIFLHSFVFSSLFDIYFSKSKLND